MGPLCGHCGAPASCLGQYDNMPAPLPACDHCCGHACEDGRCVPLFFRPGSFLDTLLSRLMAAGYLTPAAAQAFASDLEVFCSAQALRHLAREAPFEVLEKEIQDRARATATRLLGSSAARLH